MIRFLMRKRDSSLNRAAIMTSDLIVGAYGYEVECCAAAAKYGTEKRRESAVATFSLIQSYFSG